MGNERRREVKPPTRAELRRLQAECRETRRERDAVRLDLERAQKLIVDGAVDQLVEELETLRRCIERVRHELRTAPCEVLCRGPEVLAQWRTTLSDSMEALRCE